MRILTPLFLLFFALLTPSLAQYPDQATYVVGAGSANAQTATFTNANSLDDLLGVMLRIQAGATNTAAMTLTVNSFAAKNVLKPSPSGLTALTGSPPEIVTGQVFMVVWDGTNFELIGAINAAPVTCSFGNLVIINNAGTPNTSIDVSYSSSILVVPTTGASISSGVKSFTINTTTGTSGTSTANGMDGTAAGNNNMISLWAISNGTTWAGLASSLTTYPTAPTLPSGYIYACYIGTKKTNGSANFYGTRQAGNEAIYILGGNLNTTLPVVASSTAGSACATAAVYSSITMRGTTGTGIWVPSTASIARFSVTSASGGNIAVAPNSGYTSSTNFFFETTGLTTSIPLSILLEANTVQYCSTAGGGALYAYGWKDVGVNAY